MKLFLMLLLLPTFAWSALPKGHAVWVYDVNAPNAPTASWKDWLTFYNGNTLAPHTISTVYTYGGDMTIGTSFITSFPARNQLAAQSYKSVYGVKNVIVTIDGQMDGGQPFSPDLSKLTVSQVQSWADNSGALLCGFSYVDGVQVDLEPARAPYLANLIVFLKQLSSKLQACSKSMGVFLGAGAATPSMFQAIGSNGYVVLSGYDLSDAPLGSPATDPVKYGAQLTANLKLLAANAGSTGSFIVGIPGAASVHEFSQYIPTTGTPVFGYPMYSQTAESYVKQAMTAIQNVVKTNPNYLGTALWGFTLEMANPVGSRSMFYPSHPFQQAGAFSYFQGNL